MATLEGSGERGAGDSLARPRQTIISTVATPLPNSQEFINQTWNYVNAALNYKSVSYVI